MRSAAVIVFGHLDTDQIIRAQQNIVVGVEGSATLDWRKLLDGSLRQCQNPPIEVLSRRTQSSAAGELRIRNTDACSSVRDCFRSDLQSTGKPNVLLLERYETFPSPLSFGP